MGSLKYFTPFANYPFSPLLYPNFDFETPYGIILTASWEKIYTSRGVARIFQGAGGGGGHLGSNNIVMAFSPGNCVGYLLKKRLTKGGHGHPRTPLATPLTSYATLSSGMYHGISHKSLVYSR